jgi:phospholipid/cholesterol/gamma-HCH transport system substrate-binding protein
MNPLSKVVRQVRIGLFLGGSILALVITILLLGKSQALFVSRATLYTSFQNTSGLVVGSPVRLAGVDIGSVADIQLDPRSTERAVNVVLRVDEGYLPRIREDSLATMTSRGLLGDMIINITLGSPSAPPLTDGSHLQSKEAQGLSQIIASVESAVSTVNKLTSVVDARLRMVLTEQLATDIGRIAHSAANITEQIERGHGFAHDVIYEKEMARAAMDVLREGQKTARRITASVDHLESMLAEVENGDGALHALVYGKGGSAIMDQVRESAAELKDILAEVKHGRGIVHSAIYEKDEKNLIENLSHASELLAKMVDQVDRGEGTIGGLLKDPTIYQDLVSVLGEVKRNVILKALIRMTIKKDRLERPVDLPDEPREKTPAPESSRDVAPRARSNDPTSPRGG